MTLFLAIVVDGDFVRLVVVVAVRLFHERVGIAVGAFVQRRMECRATGQ